MSAKAFTPQDVSGHNSPEKGLYIIIDNGVYDVTKFLDEHPGGPKILKRVGGKDASKQFWKVSKKAKPSLNNQVMMKCTKEKRLRSGSIDPHHH